MPIELPDIIPELILQLVRLYGVDKRASQYQPPAIPRDPVVHRSVPRTVRIVHVQGNPRVVADLAILSDVIFDLFNLSRTKAVAVHTGDQSITASAISMTPIHHPLAADLALLALDRRGERFDVVRADPVPASHLPLDKLLALKMMQVELPDVIPELLFQLVSLDGIDQGASQRQDPAVTRNPVINLPVPGAVRVLHVQGDPRVLAYIPILSHVILELFNLSRTVMPLTCPH